MKYVDLQDALDIHDDIISEMQGLSGYNQTNLGYLDSALENIQNDDFYPNFEDKLTHLMFSCIKFHPFNDGNKRTSIYLAMHFLKINDRENLLDDFAQKMEDIVVRVAEDSLNKYELKEILTDILKNTHKPKGPRR